jgi:uncharacterized protein YndB with AHSA1/START domain
MIRPSSLIRPSPSRQYDVSMELPANGFLFGTVDQNIVVDAPIATVWRAFADLSIRDRWFTMPGERSSRSHELDFRIGGMEIARSTFLNFDHEERLEHRSRFLDIVDNRRISTVYDFLLNDVLKFASLLTLRFEQLPEGTRVDYTEQYQCFDVAGDGNAERGERRGGTQFYLRRLKIAVEEPSTS